MCYKGTNLVVNRGGKLLVENCTLNNVNLIVNPGGNVEVREDGNIKTCSSRDFSIPLGATLEMSTGCVKP